MSQVIVKGVIALFIVGIIVVSFSPVIDNLANDSGLWGNVTDGRALFIRDNTVTIFYVISFITFIMIIIWMWNAAQAKGAIGNY